MSYRRVVLYHLSRFTLMYLAARFREFGTWFSADHREDGATCSGVLELSERDVAYLRKAAQRAGSETYSEYLMQELHEAEIEAAVLARALRHDELPPTTELSALPPVAATERPSWFDELEEDEGGGMRLRAGAPMDDEDDIPF